MTVTLSFLLPVDGVSSTLAYSGWWSVNTLYRVGFGQLGEVHDEILRNLVPCLALGETEVDVCAGELVDVKLVQLA